MLHGDFVFGLWVTDFVHRGWIYFPYLKKVVGDQIEEVEREI
jgi:hypothetical protein